MFYHCRSEYKQYITDKRNTSLNGNTTQGCASINDVILNQISE